MIGILARPRVGRAVRSGATANTANASCPKITEDSRERKS